ncbi:MAG: DUF131 domain-containing protein [Candidatus Hodarchaeota archaeon]
MLLQQPFLQFIGLGAVVIGILLIIVGYLLSREENASPEFQTKRESKGVILVGPIPIVWGFGRTGWIIAAAVAIILFAAVVILFS